MIRFLYRLFLAVSITIAVAVVALRFAAMNRETLTAAELVMPDSQMIETVHGTLHTLVAGPEAGQPVLLIHGSVGWSGLWRPTIEALARAGYRTYALDLPPMGLSDRDTRMDFSRQAQSLRILAFIEAVGVKPIIVAHSFGAGAAVEAVMNDGDAFEGAVIVAGALNLGEDAAGEALPLPLQYSLIREAAMSATVTNPYVTRLLFQQFVHRVETITPEVGETLKYPFQRDGTTETLAAWLPSLLIPPRGAASTDVARYGDLPVPVALIWGREDTVTPPAVAEQLRGALGNPPLFWMEDTGHIPQIEDPDAFHLLLIEALVGLQER